MSALEERSVGDDIRSAAQRLAEANAESEPGIQEIYLFPSEEEIRLIEVDITTLPSGQADPFYLSSAPASGIPFPSAIALIHPEEKDTVAPPDDWGEWSQARLIWPKEN